MNTQRYKQVTIGVIALVVALLALMSTWFGPPRVMPAQAAVITPVAQTARGDARYLTFFDAEAITADTRRCFDVMDHEILQLQYGVDATLANTSTITLQQTNDDPNVTSPTPVYNAAQAIATVISADASTFSDVGLFFRWNCINVDVTNSNPIVFNIKGVAK